MRWFVILGCVFLIGCSGVKNVEIDSFVGGSEGVSLEFVDIRNEVFDGGSDPFDVTVKLQNKGEFLVDDLSIRLAGFKSQEFNKLEGELIKKVDEELVPVQQSSSGVVQSKPLFVEFAGLNHITPIVGSRLAFPLRADICYKYKTSAVSKFCVRESLLSPEQGGLCVVDESKPVFNSGSPVHVINFKQSVRGSDKLGFSFDVKHVGSGVVFAEGCEVDRLKNKVFVRVDSKISGLSCTGLKDVSGGSVEGIVTLFDGVKSVSCTQTFSSRQLRDFEQLVHIEVIYYYEDFKTAELVVKHVED